MKWLKFAVAALLVFLPATAAGLTPTPLIINSPTVPAGQPEPFVVTRTANTDVGIYVQVNTNDGTAHAGTDYVTTNKLVYMKAGVTHFIFTVPTMINPNATGSLKFSIVAAASTLTARGVGTIVEPVQNTSPVGPITVTALKSCNSLWDTAKWEAYLAANPNSSFPPLPTVVAGQQYSVMYEPGDQAGGLVPNSYHGNFVAALPVNDTQPENHGGYEFDSTCFPPPA